MNRYSAYPQTATQLMTVEEAKRLSTLDSQEERREVEQRQRVWSWQTIEGALNQVVSDEQIDSMSARSK